MRACRQIAWPNIGFLCQLKAFESKTFGECSDVPLRLEQLFGVQPTKQDPAENEGDSKTGSTRVAAGSGLAMSEE